MRIVTNTTLTPYTRNTIISPQAPMWMLDIRGNSQPVIINESIYLALGERFGVDATPFLQSVIEAVTRRDSNVRIKVVNDTQFNVRFIPGVLVPPLANLFETNFQFLPEPGDKPKVMKQREITIRISTTFTPYVKPTKILPKGNLWFLKNSGQQNTLINNQYLLTSFDTFGIDTTQLLAKVMEKAIFTGDKIKMVNDTELDISFTSNPIIISPNVPAQQVVLVETHFKIEGA